MYKIVPPVRLPGFNTSPIYSELASDLVSEIALYPPQSMEEFISRISESELANWRRQSGPFYKIREVKDEDGCYTCSINITPIKFQFAHYESRAIANNNAGGLTTVHQSKDGSFYWATGGESTRERAYLIRQMDSLISYLIRSPSIYLCGKLHWHIAQSQLCQRGTASLADIITRSLMLYHKVILGPVKENVRLDLEAFVTPMEDYARKYHNFFDSTVQTPPSPSPNSEVPSHRAPGRLV